MADQTDANQHVKLSDAAWHELFDNLEIAEQYIPGAERREHERFPFDGTVEAVAEFADGDVYRMYRVRMRNVSATGVGVIHHIEEPDGMEISITMPLAEGGALRATGIVARCDLVSEGVYDLGFHFDCMIEPMDIFSVSRMAA